MEQPKLTRRGFLGATAATGAVAAMALAGCSSSGSSSSDSKPSPDAGNAEVAEAITAALANKSDNYDPIGLNNGSALTLPASLHVFEGLYDLDLHDYTTYPALADGEPTKISDTEYEVKLRDGAKFSDGTPVTSEDVVYSIQQNIDDAALCGPFLSFINTVEAKDDTTVTIKLNWPFEESLQTRLALAKIVSASQPVEDRKKMPIGTGPWKYVSLDGNEGGTLVFEKNNEYNGLKPATCESMEWSVLPDATARTTALTDGSVLAINNAPAANASQIEAAGAAIEFVPSFNQVFLMFNCKKAPFDDKRVRQAFFYAIDSNKLISNQLDNNGESVTGFLKETHKYYKKASTVYTYDTEKAKSLLAEAGYADGIELELLVNITMTDYSAQIKEDLAAAGITVNLREEAIQWQAISGEDSIPPYDVCLTGGDPTCFGEDPDLLFTWWYGDNVWTKGRSCWSITPEWAEMQTLLQQARETNSSDEKKELWGQCIDLLSEEVPLYALFYVNMATGYYHEQLEGYAPIGTTGLVFLDTTPVK